jgi:hypothetical protein
MIKVKGRRHKAEGRRPLGGALITHLLNAAVVFCQRPLLLFIGAAILCTDRSGKDTSNIQARGWR